MFPKEYKYIIGIGLILFGFFAVKYPEYQHPIFGYINLGDYHMYIGVEFVMEGVIYIDHVRNRKNK